MGSTGVLVNMIPFEASSRSNRRMCRLTAFWAKGRVIGLAIFEVEAQPNGEHCKCMITILWHELLVDISPKELHSCDVIKPMIGRIIS